MINAKEEFLAHIHGKESVACAVIRDYDAGWDDEEGKQIFLPMNYNRQQYDAFIAQLDFEYYAGYGGQEVYGVIWYEDGTWSERGEYDGSEWWEYKKSPVIPKELK